MTSHDVVARVRRLAGTRKVGHAGTLDPMATGVLVLGVDRATRLLGHLTLTEKAYDATVRLGAATTTDDAEGEPLVARVGARTSTEQRGPAAAAAFVGDIEQVPSAVSAIKVDGKRCLRAGPGRGGRRAAGPAGDRARAARSTDVRRERRRRSTSTSSVRCSSGTYVRALARDLGAALGVGGHLTALRRTAVGPFDARRGAHRSTTLADDARRCVDIDRGGAALLPVVDLDDEQARDVGYGRKLAARPRRGRRRWRCSRPDGAFLALYEQRGELAAPVAVFA